MKTSSMFTAGFAALAAAAPAWNKNGSGKKQLATFDDLDAVPALSQVNPVGTYKGLEYTAFNVLARDVAGLVVPVGLKPQSGTQVAATSLTTIATQGGPALEPAEGFKSFDLDSMYFGCVVNTAVSAAGASQQCTLAFTVYKKDREEPFETINKQFDPSGLNSKMVKAEFPADWRDIVRLDVTQVQATTTQALNAVFIDNVSYKLNK